MRVILRLELAPWVSGGDGMAQAGVHRCDPLNRKQ